VHAHTPKGGLLGMISAAVTHVPVRIYHMRGLPYMTAKGRKRALLKMTERVSCALAHRVICVSHSIRDVAIQDRICQPKKIVVMGGGSGNGVDASGRFNPDRFDVDARGEARRALGIGIGEDDLVIGFVGRIVRDKGVEELATAWSSIRVSHPSARLVLVGPLEAQDPISNETLTTLVADRRVIMTGSVIDISPMYPLFDLVVLPTYREGFPNVPLEAAAMELPVVATLIPGCIDAVQDGVTGTLVPARDADALREAIGRYLDDPSLRQQHGKAGRERVLRDFRQEVIWEAIYQEYCRLLTQKGIPIPEPGQASS
jgi:glycosyltransferase involved in cell wall biosynthesis